MKELTLVVMAAGMGSRFGGLKQIEPVGPHGEIIADYSVYDAIKAGFTKVVFIIRKENLEYFKEHISSKFEDKIKVEYAFQELDMVPSDAIIPDTRVKMLGTGHAILCAKDVLNGNFVILNGDDFYGYDSFKKIKEYFDHSNAVNEYITIDYPISNTMSKIGAVKRGVVFTENGYVTETIESEIRLENGKYIAKPLNGEDEFEISPNQGVSMNFIGFRKEFLKELELKFDEFIHGEITDKNEFLIPEVIRQLVKEGKLKGVAMNSESTWMGITYREDLPDFKESINKLIMDGEYPEDLWGIDRNGRYRKEKEKSI